METYENRRRAKRFSTVRDVTFSDGNRFFTDFIRDMSTGGLSVESPVPFEKGTKLTLSLGAPVVKVSGIVRWCRKEGFKYVLGIQFVFDNPDQEAQIKDAMQCMFWEHIKE